MRERKDDSMKPTNKVKVAKGLSRRKTTKAKATKSKVVLQSDGASVERLATQPASVKDVIKDDSFSSVSKQVCMVNG